MRMASLVFCSIALSACAGGPYGAYGYGPDYRDNPPVRVGPSGDPPAHPLARSATYTCEDLTTIKLTEGQPTAQVTLNSGLVLALARQPDALGSRYGAPPYEFRTRGDEGSFFANNRVVRCRVK